MVGKFFLLIFLSFFGCQSYLQTGGPDLLVSRGIVLGIKDQNVLAILGKPNYIFNYRRNGNLISIWEYDSCQIDYVPAFEKDDTGILPPRSGIHPRYHRDYKLVFVNQKLYIVEDLVHNRYYVAPDAGEEVEIDSIMKNLRKRE